MYMDETERGRGIQTEGRMDNDVTWTKITIENPLTQPKHDCKYERPLESSLLDMYTHT